MVIALASFIVGAGLTGLLCCIHHRKATPKTVSKLRHSFKVSEMCWLRIGQIALASINLIKIKCCQIMRVPLRRRSKESSPAASAAAAAAAGTEGSEMQSMLGPRCGAAKQAGGEGEEAAESLHATC